LTFREKMHWASLLAILAGFGWYFAMLLAAGGDASGLHDYFAGLLVLVIGGLIVVMTFAAIVMAIAAPSEASASVDERDAQIHMRGTFYAYYTLVVGIWGIGLAAHFGFGLFIILNAALGLLVLCETIRIGVQIYLYRRGY